MFELENNVTRINGQRERLHTWTAEELRNAIEHKLAQAHRIMDEAEALALEYERQTGERPL